MHRLIYTFILHKTERNKQLVLIGSTCILKGGLPIFDIDCKLKALKAVWVHRLFNSKSVLYMFEFYCKRLNIDMPMYCVSLIKAQKI